MKFNPLVFERLLFPLHNRVYRDIQETLDIIEKKHPGKLQEIFRNFEFAAKTGTQTETWRPGKAEDFLYPSVDVTIFFHSSGDMKISALKKSKDYKMLFDYEEKPSSKFSGSHLIVGYYQGKVLHTFIAPLEYMLGFNLNAVLQEGSYQLYSHTILSGNDQAFFNSQLLKDTTYKNYKSYQQEYLKKSLIYVGITRKTWQKRYRQHCYDMGRGSCLRFHRALRGEFCRIGTLEHIVERAGLTEKQAYEIEENEVEKRSLHSLHPNGLNMIPGGYAGLKYVHNYAARTGYKFDKELSADNAESVLVEVQQQSLKNRFNTTDTNKINAEISRLWAEDINFRINATTRQRNRFSYPQIQAARIWYASGWDNEKILENLKKLDSKKISMDQLESLLKGKTYSAVPDVLV